MRSIPSLFLEYAARNPEKTAIIDGNRTYSYSELAEQFRSLSDFLADKYPPQTRIGIIMQNSARFIISFYSILLAGHIAVPLDIDIHSHNLKYIVNHCAIKGLIFNKNVPGELQADPIFNNVDFMIFDPEAADSSSNSDIVLDPFLKNPGASSYTASISPDNIAAILYTTGTSGLRKGVKITHLNLYASTRNIVSFMKMDDSIIESLPMRLSHSFGLGRCRSVFLAGGTIVVENGFINTAKLLENINLYQVNALSSVPSGFAILLNYFCDAFKEIGPQLRFVEIGSAPMPMDHKIKLLKFCPSAAICMHYGLTEASRSSFLNFREEKNFLHTIGKASPNVKIKLVNEKKEETDSGSTGEIAVSGDIVSPGYWRNKELSEKTFIDGWIYTGDYGKIDKDGYIIYKGRKSDLINKGGLKIAPLEIEKVLHLIPEISEAAVCGCPTSFPVPGFRIKAFIVPRISSKEINIAKIRKFCFDHLEEYKVPDEFESIKKLPKIGAGKIDKKQLMQHCAKNHEPQ